MDPFTTAALAAQAGTGVFKTVAGAIGKAKANKALRTNAANRPKYQIQTPILDNQRIAESRASQGLSDGAIETYRSGAQRGLTASLSAMLMGGGSMNSVGELMDSYLAKSGQLSLMDEQMRVSNVKTLMDQNKEMGGELDKKFQFNVWAPWADRQQDLTSKVKESNKLLWSGISDMGSAAANYASARQYEDQGNNVFGQTAQQKALTHVDAIQKALEAKKKEAISDNMAPTIEQNLRNQYPGLLGGWG